MIWNFPDGYERDFDISDWASIGIEYDKGMT
jgi:hypothetical protein